MNLYGDDDTARAILTTYRHFAVVGCSNDPTRASFRVARFLLDHDYEMTPVNPRHHEVLGRRCYPDLTSAAQDVPIEVVDLFRRSDAVAPHVAEALEIGAAAVWMQLGVVDEDSARRAVEAGLEVVMDRCPAIEHPRLVGSAS